MILQEFIGAYMVFLCAVVKEAELKAFRLTETTIDRPTSIAQNSSMFIIRLDYMTTVKLC